MFSIRTQCLMVVFWLVSFAAHCVLSANQTNNLSKNETAEDKIYGVRWFLGAAYKYSFAPKQLNEHYVLMFNSLQPMKNELYLSIDGNRYSCLQQLIATEAIEEHHPDYNEHGMKIGEMTQTYIHKCTVGPIGTPDTVQMNYTICQGKLMMQSQGKDANVGKYQENVIFAGVFRPVFERPQLKMIVIGDWGYLTKIGEKKGYHHVLPCLLQTLNTNLQIRLLVFVGDIAYDLQGQLYHNMLKHIEPISSQVSFMITPGNHDTLHHADTFELFTMSFYSPMWYEYYNYFYTLRIGNIVLLAYNPENTTLSKRGIDRFRTPLIDIFQKQLPSQALKDLRDNFFTIAFSHYPMFCSNVNDDLQSCEKNSVILAPYREYFKDMGLKLYLSGHLHVYERTKPICPNNSYLSMSVPYSMDCPVYIVEGVGGNNDYVQTEKEYDLKEYSASLGYNTGFGVLTLSSNSGQAPHQMSYIHFSADKCSETDSFTSKGTPKEHKTDSLTTMGKMSKTGKMKAKKTHSVHELQMEAITYVPLLMLIIILIMSMIYCVCRCVSSRGKQQEQEQQNEIPLQHFETPRVGVTNTNTQPINTWVTAEGQETA